MVVNQHHLKQAWEVPQTATRDDWIEWMQRLSVEFMRESPSHALRACMSLVDVHTPLAKELFNAAFLSCWSELYSQYQVHIPRSPILICTNYTYRRTWFALLRPPSPTCTFLLTWFTGSWTSQSSWNTRRKPSP